MARRIAARRSGSSCPSISARGSARAGPAPIAVAQAAAQSAIGKQARAKLSIPSRAPFFV
jgi:hypothetical protein